MGEIETKESGTHAGAGDADGLSSWFTGEQAGPRHSAHSVLLQSGADIRAVVDSGLLAPGALVFSTAVSDLPADGGLRLVEVEGGVDHSGDELVMSGSLYVQVFDYGSLPYLSVAGPTVIRVTCPEDHEAFLADADRAVQEGVWAEGFIHPSVQLADLTTLASPTKSTGLGRLYVTAEGQVRTGVGGQDLGAVGAGADAVRAALDAYGADPSLGSVVPRDTLHTGAAERPWLARYAHALEVRRRLSPKYGTDLRVSGFGGRFAAGLPALPVESAGQPLLVEARGDVFAVHPDGYRLFRLGRSSACLLEVFAALGAADTPGAADTRDAVAEAAAVAGRLLDIPADDALDAYTAVKAQLDGAGTARVTTGGDA